VITITPPSLGIQSTPPLGGRFVIKCPDPQDNLIIHTSISIGWWADRAGIERAIDKSIPFAAGRTWVREVYDADQPYW
jgi:hypothetical protein